MNRLLPSVAIIVALFYSTPASSQASFINGSMYMAGVDVVPNTTDFNLTTLFLAKSYVFSSGTGDLSIISPGSQFVSDSPFSSSVTIDLNNLSSFNLINGNWGSFVANGPSNQIVSRTTDSIAINLSGIFIGAGPFANNYVTNALAFLRFTQNGSSTQASFSLTTIPMVVPEPASFILCGSAIAFATIYKIRRRVIKN